MLVALARVDPHGMVAEREGRANRTGPPTPWSAATPPGNGPNRRHGPAAFVDHGKRRSGEKLSENRAGGARYARIHS
jgi:hypothetical protein